MVGTNRLGNPRLGKSWLRIKMRNFSFRTVVSIEPGADTREMQMQQPRASAGNSGTAICIF